MLSTDDIKRILRLVPLEPEGGYFAETYRSVHEVPPGSLPGAYTAQRPLATAIYYLLTAETVSALHRLPADEIYHFYLGDPVEMLQLLPDGSSKTIQLGPNLLAGMQLQCIVEAGVWQGSRLVPGGRFALLGTTMSPGYDPTDYEPARRDVLIEAYPDRGDLITALTR